MTIEYRWTFRVTGTLTRDKRELVLETYEVIVESGIRDAGSPYDLFAVDGIARPDAAGLFKMTLEISVPGTV